MYSKEFLRLAAEEIEAVLQSMPQTFTSADFISAFSSHHPRLYRTMVGIYERRRRDNAHATQITNILLMHTVKVKFDHLAEKIGDCPNPKGGTMSRWRRV